MAKSIQYFKVKKIKFKLKKSKEVKIIIKKENKKILLNVFLFLLVLAHDALFLMVIIPIIIHFHYL